MNELSNSPTKEPVDFAELTSERLVIGRWSFAEAGKKPWSKDFYFNPNGQIHGATTPNHKLWRLENGGLQILTKDGILGFVFDTVSSSGGLLCLQGKKLQNPKEGKLVELKEVAGGRPASAALPTKQSETAA